jgi:hypothetical protein
LEDVARVLRSDPRRNQIGFVAPDKPTAHERHVLADEWTEFMTEAWKACATLQVRLKPDTYRKPCPAVSALIVVTSSSCASSLRG